MVQLTDSTRRLVIFVTIVLGGSVLLIFDIPVLYLMMAVLFLTVGLLVITGTLILSELISELRIKLKSRPKKEKKPKSKKSEKKGSADGSGIAGLLGKLPLKMPSLPKVSLPKTTPKPKKEKPEKASKKETEISSPSDEEIEESPEEVEISTPKDEDLDIDLDGLDLDESLDIDAELDSVNPEFDTVRTPFGESSVMDTLPSEDAVKKMDISTSEEEEEIILDTDEPSDELDAIYSSTIDIGSDEGGDYITNMEGGDAISSSDLASYGSSDAAPYDYGGDEESGGEEQFELSQKGGLGDDDLIASLKADIADLKKKDDDVLLRDLKDIHVTAEELAEELSNIMTIITRRIKKK